MIPFPGISKPQSICSKQTSGHFPGEVPVFAIDHDVKAGAQGGEVGALGGGGFVDGFDGDPSDWLKLTG